MKKPRRIIPLFVFLLFGATTAPVFAIAVFPAVNPNDGTKLRLLYSTDISQSAPYVVKRTTGIPTATSVWAPLSGGRPQEDIGLTANTEYTYALFDAQGNILPNQTFYSQVPNERITTRASGVGAQPIGDGQPPFSPARTFVTDPTNKITEMPRGETIGRLLTRAEGVLNLIIPFIIGLAVFVILWGVFLYVTKAAEEEKRTEARLYIVWGIVAVFCMLSLWGFVNILVNSFNLQTTIAPGSIPTAPTL